MIGRDGRLPDLASEPTRARLSPEAPVEDIEDILFSHCAMIAGSAPPDCRATDHACPDDATTMKTPFATGRSDPAWRRENAAANTQTAS